jgi:hypothetical protein
MITVEARASAGSRQWRALAENTAILPYLGNRMLARPAVQRVAADEKIKV